MEKGLIAIFIFFFSFRIYALENPCPLSNPIDEKVQLQKWAGDVMETTLYTSFGLVDNSNFQIDTMCLDRNNQKDLLWNLDLMQDEVELCLNRLAEKGLTKANDHIEMFSSLKERGVNLECRDLKSSGRVSATEVNTALESYTVFLDLEFENLDDEVLRNTVFHNLFHLKGFEHDSTVDYASACESCCFNAETDEIRKLSCKICGTSYRTEEEQATYLKEARTIQNLIEQAR